LEKAHLATESTHSYKQPQHAQLQNQGKPSRELPKKAASNNYDKHLAAHRTQHAGTRQEQSDNSCNTELLVQIYSLVTITKVRMKVDEPQSKLAQALP
jgi:hypothetical protein